MSKPFVSKAQIERCRKLVAEGKMSQESFDAALAATPDHERLPERIHPKKEPKEDSEKAS
jgi:DNA mismatch repair ATPase MutS